MSTRQAMLLTHQWDPDSYPGWSSLMWGDVYNFVTGKPITLIIMVQPGTAFSVGSYTV